VFVGSSLFSCSRALPVGAIEQTDSCVLNRQHVYEVYVPAREKATQRLPLVILLDPHGDGRLAIEHFRNGADRYALVLAASDLIKNNFPGYQDAISELIGEVRKKYPVNQVVCWSGFSGGARMALDYASIIGWQGVLVSGALDTPDRIRMMTCPVLSLAGLGDFNLAETATYLFS
jgi:poly(3-hydroxybutyrate) depolymerase